MVYAWFQKNVIENLSSYKIMAKYEPEICKKNKTEILMNSIVGLPEEIFCKIVTNFYLQI